MQVTEEVLTVLSRCLEINGANVKIIEALDRKLYVKVNEVLEAVGGKWSRKAKAHVFQAQRDPIDAIENVLLCGEVTTDADLAFFQTPTALAIALVDQAQIEPGHYALEPSAGSGALVFPMLEAGAVVTAVERSDTRRQALIKFARDHPAVDLQVADVDDFVHFATSEPFDRVVMNPPFKKIGIGDHLSHVSHAYQMLVPGGTLVAVLPAGVMFRADFRHRRFREWAEQRGTITALPDDSFRESGTGVRTCVVHIERIEKWTA